MMARAKLKVRPDPPTGFLRMKCFRLADNSYIEGEYFEKFIMLCITLNTVVMACVAYNESDAKAAFIENANFAFAAIFLVEAVIKIFALHLLYFKSGWNCFDFSIVCMTILFTMLEAFAGIDVSSLANLARAFRMCLIIRLFKNAKAMQSLTNTILMNLPAMGNITALLSLVLFIYTVMGVQLFAQVLSPQEELMDLVNFQSFGNAALLLFRCLTGEAWNSIMYGLMVQEKHDWTDVYSPDDGLFVHWINPAGEISTDPNTPWIGLSATGTSCHPDSVAWPLTYKDIVTARALNNDENFAIGCSPGNPMVYIFFFTFQTITQLIALNLFIAVIIDGFETQMLNEEKQFSDSMFQIFLKEWSVYDHDADYFIELKDLMKMLKTILVPLGFNPHYLRFNEGEKELMNFVKSLNLKDYDGFVFFQDVAKQLAHRKYEERLKKVAKPDKIKAMLSVPDGVDIEWNHGEKTAAYEKRDLGFSLEERWAANVIQNVIRCRTAKRIVQQKKERRLAREASEGAAATPDEGHATLFAIPLPKPKSPVGGSPPQLPPVSIPKMEQ